MEELERARRHEQPSDDDLVNWEEVEALVIKTYQEHGNPQSLDASLLKQLILDKRTQSKSLAPQSQAFYSQKVYPLERFSLSFRTRINNFVRQTSETKSGKERLREMAKVMSNYIPYTDQELINFHNKHTNYITANEEKLKRTQSNMLKIKILYILTAVITTVCLGYFMHAAAALAAGILSFVISLPLFLMDIPISKPPYPLLKESDPNFHANLSQMYWMHNELTNQNWFQIRLPTVEQVNDFYDGHYQANLFVDENNPKIRFFLEKEAKHETREIYKKWKERQLPLRHLEFQALYMYNFNFPV